MYIYICLFIYFSLNIYIYIFLHGLARLKHCSCCKSLPFIKQLMSLQCTPMGHVQRQQLGHFALAFQFKAKENIVEICAQWMEGGVEVLKILTRGNQTYTLAYTIQSKGQWSLQYTLQYQLSNSTLLSTLHCLLLLCILHSSSFHTTLLNSTRSTSALFTLYSALLTLHSLHSTFALHLALSFFPFHFSLYTLHL